MRRLGSIAAAGLTALLCGCAGFWEDPARTVQQQREDELLREERERRLVGRIETLELEAAALRRDLEQTRRGADAAVQTRVRALEEKIAALEQRWRDSEAAREKDRREIVDVLSKRMAELLQTSGASSGRTGAAPRRSPNRSGWEHEVKPGESLSTIAAAYGARVADIVEANQLRDAHMIRVGQKLFIPEP